MICEECGSPRVFWRCDNHKEKTSKWKCKDCGTIKITKTRPERLKYLKEQEKERKKKSKANRKKKTILPPKYYHKHGNKYQIKKTVNGKQYYYGTYDTEKEAKLMVELLRLYDWDIKELPRLKEVLK